jgi:dTDP-4-amino-4,6-dideoxygalactose transaminase/lipopolysaccharide/colanic/teichoic acid biosynthesis glycosyltransferase
MNDFPGVLPMERGDTAVNATHAGYDLCKRVLDFCAAVTGLLILSPLIAAVAVAVWFDSRGPLLYCGIRVGRGGRHFRMFKFRTMVEDAEKLGGSATAGDDPRITRIGRWLRRYKLDELPQLLNVLRGEMSLVGPRPEVPKYADRLTADERVILIALPGITDWASIWNSHEEDILEGSPDPERSYEELIRPTKLALQLLYVRRRSLIVDFRILFHTALRLLGNTWTPHELIPYDRLRPYRLLSPQSSLSSFHRTVTQSEELPLGDEVLAEPAILGGPPAFREKFRFHAPLLPDLHHVFTAYEDAYRTGLITNANLVARLEAAVAGRLGVKHCVAVSSCTSGLMMVLRALGLTGEVILPSFTFFATGHALRWNGLQPVFADCDASTWNVDPADVERKITPHTSAILAVHLYGNPCDVSALERLAARHRLRLIFDAAHGFGSEYQGRPVGQFGDAEVFSLSPTKLLVAGEGGLVTTNDASIARAIRYMRNYGDLGAYDPLWLGLNARMSEFNASLALAGLPLVDAKVERRNHIANLYTRLLAPLRGLRLQKVVPGDLCAYKDFSILIQSELLGLSRDFLANALLRENIETKKYFYPPLHQQALYREFCNAATNGLHRTNAIAGGVLSLPNYEMLGDKAIENISRAIQRIVSHQPARAAATLGLRNQHVAIS